MRIFRVLAIAAAMVALATFAAADPVTPPAVVNFQNNPSDGTAQGTASGFFTITSSGGALTISDFSFSVTQSADCCTSTLGFPAYTYTTGNSTSSLMSFANGDQEVGVNSDPHVFPGGGASVLVMHFNCGGVTDCLTNNLASNNSFSVTFSEVGEPDGLPFRTTGAVFMHITDQPGVFSLNLDPSLVAGTTLIGGTGTGNNGGGGTTVPEPSMILLLGSSLGGFALRQFKRQN